MSTPPRDVLDLSVQSFTANQLAIKVKNKSAAVLEKKLHIKLTLPDELVGAAIASAAEDAADKIADPPGMADVTTLMTGPPGWSVCAMGDPSESVVDLIFFNSRDRNWRVLNPPIKLDVGADFTIVIPLKSHTEFAGLAIPYRYQHGPETDGPPLSDTLELRPPAPTDPKVTLTTDEPSPTMIKPGKEVEISWEVENAVSATLRGPLPGGNTEWFLSDDPDSKISMHKGLFEIAAVGPMTYILQAQVSRPGKANLQVIKMLSLDIYSSAKYGYVAARWPRRVLPYGLVEVDWAAWGVKSVILETIGASRQVPLTGMSVTGFLQGVGVMRITAGKAVEEKSVPVTLNVELGEFSQVEPTNYKVIPWTPLQSEFTGRPIGLAVAVPNMALLTTDGLWITKVEEHDTFEPNEELEFIKISTPEPKAWLAIAALGNEFVILRQTKQDDLQVALYSFDGLPSDIPPLDLPVHRPFMTSDAVFDLAIHGDRAYVVVENPSRSVRSAFSVGFEGGKAEYRHELLLDGFWNYRLLTFDDALYALNRDSGEMFRFELKDGELEPHRAASAIDEKGASMVKRGLLVPVGHVLAVLSPTSVPSLETLKAYGLKNILPYKNLTPPKSGKIPQDLVYSPQNNRWTRCGHGLNVKEGVVAFRGGESPRLWLIDPNPNAVPDPPGAKTYTLHVQSEYLFLQDYVKDLPAKPLPVVFNEKCNKYRFINNTGMEFVPMNETCFRAGLKPFSAGGRAYFTPPLPTGPISTAEPVEFLYNDADPQATATLRFLAKRGRGIEHEYVLEVTLSGPRFSYSTAVFKRLTPNAQGGVSVVEVPGKRESPITSGLIEVLPRQLGDGIRLRIRNATPYKTLWLRSPDELKSEDQQKEYDEAKGIAIRYDTPRFSIYAHGAGEMPVDVDFTLPDGIEMSPASEVQKKRIRFRKNGAQPFGVESISIKETGGYSAYECTLRYQVEKTLNGAYFGDGVPSNDGATIYLPIAEPPGVTNAKILKIDADNLQTTAQASVTGWNIFYGSNSIAVLEDRILANFNREQVNVFYHDLRSKPGLSVAQFEYDVLTSLKGSGPYIFTVGYKEDPTSGNRYNYRNDSWFFDGERLHHYTIGSPSSPRMSAGRSRVPGAPSWVAPNTISPMDVRPGAAMAICIEGGVMGGDLKNNWKQIDVELPGTGREEAIHVDPTEDLIFSAHSKAGGSGLMISRINVARPSEKLTIELPTAPFHVVTDLSNPSFPKLDYYRARAVSLRATSDALFVSHGTKIYVLDKTNLTQRKSIQLRLPARLIQVRRGKPPGEKQEPYDAPQECYFVWAISSRYSGNGEVVRANGQDFETILYKIAIL